MATIRIVSEEHDSSMMVEWRQLFECVKECYDQLLLQETVFENVFKNRNWLIQNINVICFFRLLKNI